MSPAARGAWRWFKRIAPWVLAAVVLALVAQQARAVDWPAVWQALRDLPAARLVWAVALAVVGYGVYASFDLVGRYLTGHPLSVPRTLATAATCYVFNLNFGALVGGFAMRLRLYLRGGLDAPSVAKVIALSMVTNWTGYLALGGVVLLGWPPRLPEVWAVNEALLRGAGALMIALSLAYLVLCAMSKRRTLRWREHTLALPGGRLALLQVLAGAASWMLMGAIIWVLFGGRVAYPEALGALLMAAMAGVITHVPAGLGVLEAVFVAVLAGRLPTSEVVAVVLAYRAVYYLLPLAFALPAYGWSEMAARRKRMPTQAAGRAPLAPRR
ncbi:lysylphosphatidylglycerol synthase domain-containing protein [Hydrogenophaga sp. BPS33]|uniref:lysylphosphatidylglycerol synthase domain-containing protein n=1 Tax=Hydrogenophaga sp. BPS33 TaxID=2651974 RepID=UPI00131F7EC6|nr:lysylphosphatidylglycerol synthase domain-containing protein [Hydrogenophaga sp. BPS33]QHE87262.1 UPF0104 family protein [Hydrogenophaga sp. BPS33]